MRAALLPLLLLAGCSAPEPSAAPADGGPAAEGVPAAAKSRVVSLAPSVTDVIFALGAGGDLVGATRFCEPPAGAAPITRVGGFLDPSFEAILALKPTRVIATPNPGNAPILRRLEDLGVAITQVRADTLGQTWESFEVVGAAVGRAEAGRALAARIRGRVDALSRAARAGGDPPRVLFVYGHRPLVVAGPGTFADELMVRAGAQNVAADAKVQYPKYTFEAVLQARPDVIVDAFMGPEADGEAVVRAFWAPYDAIPAVKAGRVHWGARPGLLRPGPQVGDGLSWLVSVLHPGARRTDPPGAEGGAP